MAIHRAQGCWLGQLTGDALGSLVEFQSPAAIRRLYPEGVRYLAEAAPGERSPVSPSMIRSWP